jgi:PAS domain S-box-containing protein
LETVRKKSNYSFLQGGGEMGELTRNFNWSLTPVGDPEFWPQSLRNTVSMILSSKFPMFLWWGEDMIQFYNDAYRPSLGNTGKHPLALGQKAVDCWPEIWDIIYPLIRQVQTTGEGTWSEDQLVPIYRNGKIEDVYWTFGYSAIRSDSDKIEGVLVVCQETTKKVIAAKDLEKSVSNLHSIISNAPVAMCILRGEQYIVETVNDRVLELWGRKNEEVINKPLFYALPEIEGQGLKELLDKVFSTGEPFTAYGQPVSILKNGKMETVYLNFVYEAYREPDGSISGIMALANDVTEQVNARHKIEVIVAQRTGELEEANEALKRMNHELTRSNANLEEFAYAASHDMKEPIRKIHFFSDRMRSSFYDKLTEVERNLFDRMDMAANRMSSLIDDLLTYSQVSLKPHSFDRVDLNTLVNQIISDFDLEIEQKKAKLVIDRLPVILAHQNQLRQAFMNLVSNALKYVKENVPPEINIRYSLINASELPINRHSEKNIKQYHLITFTDNGIGFENSDAERIFNVFTRLHGNAEYKGTGVGLSISKKVIENHYGFIVAEGEPDNGACFKIYLPANQL